MLVLRLVRTGRRNQPKFRLVAAEHSKPTDGRVVEILGDYNPTAPEQPFTINKEAVEKWLGHGAQPSNTVARLLNTKYGFNLKVEQRPVRGPKKAARGEAKPAAGPTPAVEAAPAEESVAESAVVEEPNAQEVPVEPAAPVAETEASVEPAALAEEPPAAS
ncbi:MAG: 30S ribosomal protein S16 [bacterium]